MEDCLEPIVYLADASVTPGKDVEDGDDDEVIEHDTAGDVTTVVRRFPRAQDQDGWCDSRAGTSQRQDKQSHGA